LVEELEEGAVVLRVFEVADFVGNDIVSHVLRIAVGVIRCVALEQSLVIHEKWRTRSQALVPHKGAKSTGTQDSAKFTAAGRDIDSA
jgi:hypothetical protein